MAAKDVAVSRWIRHFLEEEPPRAKSLCVTVLGDSIAPHGGIVWLGGLIKLLAPFGINDRLVRTSVFRLTGEGWLESRREGRRSLYALTASGRRRFEHAHRRIYALPYAPWNGAWTLVLLPRTINGTGERTELRGELEREGFGVISPGVFVHPSADTASLRDMLQALELEDKVFVLSAKDLDELSTMPIRELVGQCWKLDELAEAHRRFITRFEPITQIFRERMAVNACQAFAVRSLLIHAYRRVILDDPHFPAEILPQDWAGHRASELCRELYRSSCKQAEEYLAETLREEDHAFTEAAPYLFERFGGLM